MKKNMLLAVMTILLIVAGCAQNSPTGPSGNTTPDIAIKGKWLTWNTGVPYLFTVSDSQVTYTNSGIGANVVKYDNTKGYCILYWTTHPAYAHLYQKESWTNLTSALFTASIYTATNSSAVAESQTNKLMTYVCSNRP